MQSSAIIQPWNEPAFRNSDIIVDVLRLDLLHPIISGNKWLKLQGYFRDAAASRKAGILTKGGPWSNHIHAAAYGAKMHNLHCTLLVRAHATMITPTIADCVDWGAELQRVNRITFYDEPSAETLAVKNNLLYIPMGGADITGIDSVINFLSGIKLPGYSHAVCAVGTGTTMAGLAFFDKNFQVVIGIESGTNDPVLHEKVAIWQHQLPGKKLQLSNEFGFGGFAKTTPELILFINNLFSATGIPTDIVYTGKLFYAVKEMAVQSKFTGGSRVLIIHSGGLQGNRSLPRGLLQF